MITSKIKRLVKKWNENDDDDSSSNEDLDNTDSSDSPTAKKRYKTLAEEFDTYMEQIPVIGFSSARYDLNLLQKYIPKHLK